MADQNQIDLLKSQKKNTKGALTRIKTLIETRGPSLSLPELECRLGILESYFKQLLTVQTSYEALVPDDSNSNHAETRGGYEELYVTIKTSITSLIATKRKDLALPAVDLNNSIFLKPPSSTLQKVKLPHFNGKYSDYPNFIGLFNKSIDSNDQYDIIEKCNILVNSLEGPAKNAVKEFRISEENYPKILLQLKNRFDNKSLMFQELISELFDLPKISKPFSNQLRNLVDNVNAIVSSMKSIGTDKNIANALIIHVVMGKLDPVSQAKWEDSLDFARLSQWDDCATVLSKRCQFLECRESKNATTLSQTKNRFNHNNHRTSTTLSVSQSSRNVNPCAFCNNFSHNIYKCDKFTALPVMERFAETKRLALCINCLKTGHSVKKCTSSKCRVCSSPHNSLLHRYNPSLTTQSDYISQKNSLVGSEPSASTSNTVMVSSDSKESSSCTNDNNVILATAIVNILDSTGCPRPIRALLDSGSQLNFISEHMMQLLKLKKSKIQTRITGIGNSTTNVKFTTSSVIRSRINQFELNLQVLVLPTISGTLPDSDLAINHWNIPKNIELADPLFHKKQKVDLLIGAESFFEMLSIGQIRLGPQLPTLQKTVLGWIVSGRFKTSVHTSKAVLHTSSSEIDVEPDVSLNNLVEKFWKLENFNSIVSILSEEEKMCEELFIRNTFRDSTGRIVVKLPFKENIHNLGKSYNTAEKRFYFLEKKLTANRQLKDQYLEFLKEYEDLDHMKLVPRSKEHLVKYYLPHHCVLRPDSSSTKIRVVFDGSCQTTSNISLNDTLMVGPTIQDDLFSIIVRFRFYKYALKADICKMYRQIFVTEDDSYYQCILWRSKPEDKLNTYRLKTVTYGTSSAPYLATKSLSYLASQNRKDFPVGSKVISKDFYVDDLITGGNSLSDVDAIRCEVTSILQSAGMELRKWHSNNENSLVNISELDRDTPISIDGSSIIKTLGTVWHPKLDEFRFTLSNKFGRNNKISKRTVLSDLSRLFDPLGLINPIIVKGKIFMQRLWLLKLDWDESLPAELHTKWQNFTNDLNLLSQITFPRFVFSDTTYNQIQIHGFADASLRAYGACIYIRSTNVLKNINVSLLTAKSKVAPTKTQSIPRLELCAALLLAKLFSKVHQNIKSICSIKDVFLWTDSEIVLDQLATHSSSFNIFVANRVSQIQELTECVTWRHVTTGSNPADILSRGSTVQELLDSNWYNGPEFLHKAEECWPPTKLRNPHSNLPDVRTKEYFSLQVSQGCENILMSLIDRFSSFDKIINIVGYAKRFIINCKKPKINTSRNLSALERDESMLTIVSWIQQTHFASEINDLKKRQQLSSKSHIRCLNPFLDTEMNISLLKVGGRLKNADIPYSAKYPILLPKNHKFVNLLIKKFHFTNFHAGPQSLLAFIRQRFWIVNGRTTVANVVKKCIRCFRFRPKLLNQIMGDLPSDRVTPNRASQISGVDFCGPVMISPGLRGKHLYKAYISVFVCFSTHAVHLEVVSSLSSDGFIAALKRFVARRGICSRLYCDNATNFVGARALLKEFQKNFCDQQNNEVIARWCSNQGIEFCHIPARSPHFGGLWESAVKSAKFHLNRMLLGINVTFEEMTTFTAQVEAIINSRPLAPLSSDPSDEQALTPGHFLIGCPLNAIPEKTVTLDNFAIIKRFNHLSNLQHHFWKRWSEEYIKNLQKRYKWNDVFPNVELGMLVLIAEDNLPPQQWSLGRIKGLHPGRDGKVRVVDILAKGKTFRRQIQSIAPLPIQEEIEGS